MQKKRSLRLLSQPTAKLLTVTVFVAVLFITYQTQSIAFLIVMTALLVYYLIWYAAEKETMNQRKRGLLLALTILVAFCGVVGLWVQRERQQYARNRQLIAALENDDAKTALALVNAGGDPNTRRVPLPAPTFRSLLARLLRRSPPPVNNSPTALHLACGEYLGVHIGLRDVGIPVHEDPMLVQAMLTHGANVNALDHRHCTALVNAGYELRLPTIALLVQHGANVDAQNSVGQTPLIFACLRHSEDSLRLLLEGGASPNISDEHHQTPLHYVLHDSRYDINFISKLLKHGADPNIRDDNGRTPLSWARGWRGADDIVRLLKQYGAK